MSDSFVAVAGETTLPNMPREGSRIFLSMVFPCLNEARTIGAVIGEARNIIADLGVTAEIIIVDNGSSDGSDQIALSCGVQVLRERVRGYGAALLAGIRAAAGEIVVIADADGTYDLSHIPRFLACLQQGNDLVIGNRFRGGVMPGAMRPLHRYLGNPLLSALGRLFFPVHIGDFHCGMRAFRREAIAGLDLRTVGMEFATEMIAKAALKGLWIAEVPTVLLKDKRTGNSHLRSFRDGWRHLRFMLLYCPRWLFLYPGVLLMLLGVGIMALLLPGPRQVGQFTFDVHTLFVGLAAILVGFQSALFDLYSRIFAMSIGLKPETKMWRWLLRTISLEAGLLVGMALLVGGGIGLLWVLYLWGGRTLSPMESGSVARIVIPSVGSLVIGSEVILSSFFLGMLRLMKPLYPR